MKITVFFLIGFLSVNYCEIQLKGLKNFTGIYLGNLNLIITAPHGGLLKPDNIQSRTEGNLGDTNTLQLSIELKNELASIFKANGYQNNKPFLVYNELHREKMDPNRDMTKSCANEVDDCRQAYNDFHFFIKKYFVTDLMGPSEKKFEQGLLIDIHGQSHAEGWIELGYLLTSKELDTQVFANKSSIRLMASLSTYSFEDLLRGDQSFGSILQNTYNYDTVPSPKFKSPNGGNYYSGGFITETYGSKYSSADRINAIQIEFPFSLRKSSAYKLTAKNMANAIYAFYKNNNLDRFVA